MNIQELAAYATMVHTAAARHIIASYANSNGNHHVSIIPFLIAPLSSAAHQLTNCQLTIYCHWWLDLLLAL